MLDKKNNQNNSPNPDQELPIHGISLSTSQIRNLKWAVILMSILLVLGFGLVLYKMTDILLSSIDEPVKTNMGDMKEGKIPISKIKLEGRRLINFSFNGSKIMIQLEKADKTELWIYNRAKNRITEKIILEN